MQNREPRWLVTVTIELPVRCDLQSRKRVTQRFATPDQASSHASRQRHCVCPQCIRQSLERSRVVGETR
jgi:hypothetical protein